jgi:hypothetical protein
MTDKFKFVTAVLQGGLNRALTVYQRDKQQQQQQQQQQLLSSADDQGAAKASTDAKATTKAVISKPLNIVPGEPSASAKGLMSVELDGSSSTAQPGATLTTAAWSIIRAADKTNVANANGLVASVLLPPGQYEAGLLVLDSLLGSDIALTQFEVQFEVVVAPPADAGRH